MEPSGGSDFRAGGNHLCPCHFHHQQLHALLAVFISDLKELGIDPGSFVPTDREQLLIDLGQQIVKDPTAVSDELFAELKKVWKDNELVVIVGFAAQTIATNNFISVFQIDIDSRLLPIKDEFKPATWRATQA